jgi:hypothetical protein
MPTTFDPANCLLGFACGTDIIFTGSSGGGGAGGSIAITYTTLSGDCPVQ